MAVSERAPVLGRVAPWRRVVDGRGLPGVPVAAIVAAAFALAAIWARSIHTFSVMPDELGYMKQSIEIFHRDLLVGPHNFWFNSWGQLLPLLSAPLFGGLNTVDAYYASHTLYALLLASTAIPAYLLARELGLGRLAAYLVSALTVAVPWLAYSGLIMSEVVAYPAFVWAILGMTRAVSASTVRRDLIALAGIALAFFARTQFVVLAPALMLAILVHDLSIAPRELRQPHRRAVPRTVRWILGRHSVLWSVTGVVLVVAVVLVIRGSGSTLLGSYVTSLHGSLFPAGTVDAGLLQLDGITIGIGVVPLTLCAAWVITRIIMPTPDARHAFASVLVVLVPVLVVMLGSFVTTFLGLSTTDRYMFYLEPLLFVGTAAWVLDRRGSIIPLLLAGVAVGWLVLTQDLHFSDVFSIVNPDYAFNRVLVGQGYRVSHALGLGNPDTREVIVAASSAFALLAFAARRWLRPWRAVLVVMLPLLAFGVASTRYAFTKIGPQFASISASHPRGLIWVDRAIGGGATAGVIVSPYGPAALENPGDTWYLWWQTTFWNKSVRRAFVFPSDDTFAQGFVAVINQDTSHGRLVGTGGVKYLIKLEDDSRYGLRAPVVGRSGTALIYKVPAGAPLTYGTDGLNQYGWLVPHARNHFVRFFPSPGVSTTQRERVTLILQTYAAQARCPCRLRLGPGWGGAVLPPASASGFDKPLTRVTRLITIPRGGYVQLNLDVVNRRGTKAAPWVNLQAVQIRGA